jgi:uncharacterized protein
LKPIETETDKKLDPYTDKIITMSIPIDHKIAQILSLPAHQIAKVRQMLEEGATVPFIARYRKEQSGGMNELDIEEIQKQSLRIKELEERRAYILQTIFDQGKLTKELEQKIKEAEGINELEDLYLPYKPKRKTRASMAKELGLEPLANVVYAQGFQDPFKLALKFLSDQVSDVQQAIQGAQDIIAEWISEEEFVRQSVRQSFDRYAILSTTLIKGKEKEGEKYQDYFQYEQALKNCPSHRLLAIRRAEKEGILRMKIEPEMEKSLQYLERRIIKKGSPSAGIVKEALEDSLKRLIFPSIETELRASSKLKADEEAIKVFRENLVPLLMAPPLGEQTILAIDPGFRTGCKIVALDEQGNLLEHDVIYPHPPQKELQTAEQKVIQFVERYNIKALAIGNGTAGRETMDWCAAFLEESDIEIYTVNESGASIYSASEIAREEFPNHDITVRGAVSIGRRLMDPLAELVKIDPKSIGVGQYQHDVDQKLLKEALDKTIVYCVNQVGVQLNTASKYLLTHIAGLGPALAKSIVEYRATHGPFKSRKELLKVPKLGPKAYEQCAGFLRIRGATNPLDNTGVHPERYPLVERMAKDLGSNIDSILQNSEQIRSIEKHKYISDEVGLPTIEDILKELAKPGLDPRGKASPILFSQARSMEQLQVGSWLNGVVTNITNFGAFVDVGVKQDGMIHLSQITKKFIKSPAEVLHLGQEIQVRVVAVDLNRKRITLSCLEDR